MLTLILVLACQESDYAARLGVLNDSIAAERQKAAEGFEKLRAWAMARAEYRKLLRIDPADEKSRRKLQGAEALPTGQPTLSTESAAQAVDLLWSVARVAAPGHAALARWCEEKEMKPEAARHWRLALLYSPVNSDALKALGFLGDGGWAVDPVWKDLKWKDMVSKADPGKEGAERSELEKKWSIKTAKRSTPAMEWEGIDVTQEGLKTLARFGEADVAFMAKLLGVDQPELCVKRFIVMTGQAPYLRYIDDVWEAPASVKELLRATGGAQNVKRKEFILFSERRGDPHLESYVSHSVGEFALAAALGLDDYDASPAWLKEGIGCTCELLFRGRAESSCVALPEGTTTGDLPWQRAATWDNNLRTLVGRGTDSELSELAFVTLNAMKADQRAKSASVVTFLALRWPEGFRALIAEARKNPKDVRAMFEAGLGISVEECDEFWRRWIRSTAK